MKAKICVLSSSIALMFSLSAQAETIGEALNACKNKENSLKRLMCYDDVAKSMDKYSGLDKALSSGYTVTPRNTTASAQPSPAPQAETSSKEATGTNFGLEHKEPDYEDADKIYGAVVKAEETPFGKHVITLDNGTVWQQTDSIRYKVKEGQQVYVERGLLGAFYLSRDDINSRMKVKRIK